MELSLFFLELISEWIVYYMTSPTIRSINEIIGKIVPILIGVILILIINYKKLCIKMDKRKIGMLLADILFIIGCVGLIAGIIATINWINVWQIIRELSLLLITISFGLLFFTKQKEK